MNQTMNQTLDQTTRNTRNTAVRGLALAATAALALTGLTGLGSGAALAGYGVDVRSMTTEATSVWPLEASVGVSTSDQLMASVAVGASLHVAST